MAAFDQWYWICLGGSASGCEHAALRAAPTTHDVGRYPGFELSPRCLCKGRPGWSMQGHCGASKCLPIAELLCAASLPRASLHLNQHQS